MPSIPDPKPAPKAHATYFHIPAVVSIRKSPPAYTYPTLRRRRHCLCRCMPAAYDATTPMAGGSTMRAQYVAVVQVEFDESKLYKR